MRTDSRDDIYIDAVFAINVKVPFVLVGELAPAMASRGKGAIVNVGTMTAEFGMPGTSLYGASKAALVLLTRAWAAEFGPGGVRVNAVNPGTRQDRGHSGAGRGDRRVRGAGSSRSAGFTGRDRRRLRPQHPVLLPALPHKNALAEAYLHRYETEAPIRAEQQLDRGDLPRAERLLAIFGPLESDINPRRSR